MKKLIMIIVITFVITNLGAKAQEIQIWKSGIENIENSTCQEPKPGNINFTIEKKDESAITKYTLFANNISSELGIKYHWQVFSTKDQKWKDLPGENLTKLIIVNENKNHFTPTYYRFKTTCQGGISSCSNSLLIL